jgi:asparagine synthase (glutamine-hydrolysing)
VCGICGVVQVRGQPRPVLEPEILDRMTDAMTHRGPNDRGTYMSDGIALGVRRLSVVDVEGGHQPFPNENGTVWGIQNGELYNHVAIRRELEHGGHVLASQCDTEILPHLYEEHGPRFMEHLRGMFGLAVWDERERRAVIARDRLGIKPIYFAEVGDLVVFASELKSLLASGLIPAELDYDAIDSFLTLGFVPGPRTPLARVRKLLPGHRLIVDRGSLTAEAYWSYPRPAPVAASVEECAERLLAELDESVKLRLMSDVPLGAMLSGGLDSSLIVALMARHMTEPVKTFSIGFAEAGKSGNELADARFVAGALEADHHELELSLAQSNVDFADLVWHLDEPLADLSALGFLALSELASRHVTVALSGQGADELLGGYRKHQAAAIASAWSRLPRRLRGFGASALARSPARNGRVIRTLLAANPAERLLATGHLAPELRERLVCGPLADLDGQAGLRALLTVLGDLGAEPLPAALYLDGQLGLVDDMLHYFDRASMAYSLEVRVPFLDHHVVEYCATIPASFKVHRLETKHVLKRAARGLIPDRIIDRRKVGFFNGAVDDWFRAQMGGAMSDYLLGPNPRYAEMLDRREVERLVRAHVNGSDTSNGYLLLSVLMLEVWLSDYLPRSLPAQVSKPRPVSVR